MLLPFTRAQWRSIGDYDRTRIGRGSEAHVLEPGLKARTKTTTTELVGAGIAVNALTDSSPLCSIATELNQTKPVDLAESLATHMIAMSSRKKAEQSKVHRCDAAAVRELNEADSSSMSRKTAEAYLPKHCYAHRDRFLQLKTQIPKFKRSIFKQYSISPADSQKSHNYK